MVKIRFPKYKWSESQRIACPVSRFKMFQGRRDTLFPGKRDILPSGNDFILWESDHLSSGNRTTYPLGIGPLILWDSGHPLGNMTCYPLGFGPLILVGNILWESGIWEMRCNRNTYKKKCLFIKSIFFRGNLLDSIYMHS